ncbi:MAG: rod shape-determining protein MreC [bacterium]
MRIFSRTRTLLLVVVAIILLHIAGILSPVERGVSILLRPVQRTLSSWVPFRFSTNDRDQNQRFADLEKQVARLLTENALLKENRREESAFSNQQSFLSLRNLKGVSATIIGRSPEGDERILLLDRGKEQGITAGQPVITNDGIFIGTIRQSDAGRSFVLLVTDARGKVACEVENSQRSPGLIVGEHGLTMIMKDIPQNEKIAKDQIVVTSALDANIPSNLVVGMITSIHFSTGDLFQQALVRPIIDLQRLRYVTVILS